MATGIGPDDPEVRTAAEVARVTLTRLGARPMLERLETTLSNPKRGAEARPGVAASAEDRSAVGS